MHTDTRIIIVIIFCFFFFIVANNKNSFESMQFEWMCLLSGFVPEVEKWDEALNDSPSELQQWMRTIWELLVIYNLIIIWVPFVIMNAFRARSNVLLSWNSLSLDDVRGRNWCFRHVTKYVENKSNMRFIRLNGSRLIGHKKVVGIIKTQNAFNETFCADGAEKKSISGSILKQSIDA